MKEKTSAKKDKITWGDAFPKYRISIIYNGRIKRIRIEGAKKLFLCLDREVKISLGEELFRALGQALVCTSYASGALEVSGDVQQILFEKSGEKKERVR